METFLIWTLVSAALFTGIIIGIVISVLVEKMPRAKLFEIDEKGNNNDNRT